MIAGMVRSNRGRRKFILADWVRDFRLHVYSTCQDTCHAYLRCIVARACCTSCNPWRKTAYSAAPLLQDEASCQHCVMQQRRKNDINAMHVVQCFPEHCVLRPPLLPRLECLRDIRSANSCLKRCVCPFHRCCLGGLIHWTTGMISFFCCL